MKTYRKSILVVFAAILLAMPLLAACSDDDDDTDMPTATTEPTQEPTPTTEPTATATEPAGGPAWEYTVTYEDEVTAWSKAVVGEETIDGVDCHKVVTTFDANPFRYAAPTGTPIKLLEMTEFLSKDTLDMKQSAAFSNALGMIDLTSTQTASNFSGDHGQPYAFGDKYTLDLNVDLIPDTLAPSYMDTNEVEVIAVEDVTVPAGTFRCYKVATTRIGTSADGTGEIGQMLGHEWWAADYTLLAPVKIVRIANWQAEETMVLESYDPMPEMNADIPEPTAAVTPEPADDVIITIGNITDMTGPAANAMVLADYALADIVRYYNEEIPIPGVELEIISYNGEYDASKDIPGYEWLKERGADVFLSSLPSTALTLKNIADSDQEIVIGMGIGSDAYEPPGYVFSTYVGQRSLMYTLLDWVVKNDPDFPTDRPAKIGAAGWTLDYSFVLADAVEKYCDAHPDQFEFMGSYQQPFLPSWGPEVEALLDADYVLPPTTGFGVPGFVNEYRDAGGQAKFLDTDAVPAFISMIVESSGWEKLDGMLLTFPSGWWNEDTEGAVLANKLVDMYRPGDRQEIWEAGPSYIGPIHQHPVWLEAIRETCARVGPDNFNTQELYNTLTSFSMCHDDGQCMNYTDTRRYAWDYLKIYEWDAEAQDLIRADPNLIPVRLEP
ncbi:MAG: ABC transporter substrate-binding protein [Proteobacteria bacterium]|nr:ABC transporter substrate-binding protein [Pseudomonadota bacterium]